MAQTDNNNRGHMEGGRLVPIPDPTVLTTMQLDREISNLESRFASELKSLSGQITTVQQLDQGHFERIQIQFGERDKQVALALGGQKEFATMTTEYINTTIAKMDSNYTKLFDQMQVLLASTKANFDDKVSDLKGRIDRTDASKGRVDVMQIFSAAASIAAIVTVVYILVTRH